MKKYMPLNGLRWSRDSGSTLCGTPPNGVLGQAGGVIISALGHFASLQQATSIAGILHRRHKAAVTILKTNNFLQPSVITHY